MVVGSELQITPISEFKEIAKRDEVFFWHFIPEKKDYTSTQIQPMYGCENPEDNILLYCRNLFGVKIYESYTKDSYDFLINMGYTSKQFYYQKGNNWLSQFIGFKKGLLIDATHLKNKCYCASGILGVIRNTDPKTFESVLGIEKEDLE